MSFNAIILSNTPVSFMLTKRRLFESGMLADVEIKCGDHTWKLHKVILCTRNIWFKRALMGTFKVRTFYLVMNGYPSCLLTVMHQEAGTGIVTLEEREERDADCFLKFIYTGSVDLQKSYPEDDAFVALMRIWKTAKFFFSDSLCNLAVHAANEYAKDHTQVFCSAFPGADHEKEMDSIINNSFKPALSFLYSKEMKHFAPTFLPIYKRLAAASVHRLSESEAFHTLLREVPDFAAEWATSLMRSFKVWNPLNPKRAGGCCYECGKDMGGKGTVDSSRWIRNELLIVTCDRCYRMPDLAEWADTEEAKRKVKIDRVSKKNPHVVDAR